MIRTLAITQDLHIKQDVPLDQLSHPSIKWFWVDFASSSEEEGKMLDTFFHFHPLAIEDCFHFLQRPKLDYYADYSFLVLHYLNNKTLDSEELDLFVGENYLVTFHYKPLPSIETVWQRLLQNPNGFSKGVSYITYAILDQLVDDYFPIVYEIEDQLNEIESRDAKKSIAILMDDVFDIRSDLLKLRKTILPMRDLLYRIINSERLNIPAEQKAYFNDIYDHLLKLTNMVEANRDMTSDMRDNYLSINANRMNSIMMTLTIISSIFIPLTFVVGLYGMNFDHMPELHWHYGYYIVLGIMVLMTIGMIMWFKRKGWFNVNK
ncbi:magnesium/cobalt transporter CorA [Priestia megaterium]|uniref:magnesium/cobalt transporter CorA n=1 Tax=Priestia megaterium TaxID=1404 RepID=UPI0027309779|nr:magnesium/cobalt transporter CorA [Priestia megaterium]MDP1471843.1 magnesium/cobalt transporter CorA [Priestia megaterium]